MTDEDPISAADVSLWCLASHPNDCARETCKCWCHGGVREPLPTDPTIIIATGKREL